MLLGFQHAAEGLGDEVAFQRREVFGRDGGGQAGGFCEEVDEFEDEEAGEGAAEVGDAGLNHQLGCGLFGGGKKTTYVARRVMYVPPIAGSAILAWKALIATNITVLMKVLKTCSTMTRRR